MHDTPNQAITNLAPLEYFARYTKAAKRKQLARAAINWLASKHDSIKFFSSPRFDNTSDLETRHNGRKRCLSSQ